MTTRAVIDPDTGHAVRLVGCPQQGCRAQFPHRFWHCRCGTHWYAEVQFCPYCKGDRP